MPSSTVCRYEHFETDWHRRFDAALKMNGNIHRKAREFTAICAALEERGILSAGKSGLGFAVGDEPLSSYFASCGIDVLATDLAREASRRSWIATGQHAASREAVFHSYLVDRATFDARVSFRPADMRKLDDDLGVGQFDFLWSACAIEHLGSLNAGLDFVRSAMRFLKPGGIAVHTTEYNVSSNDKTIKRGQSIIYRRQDLESLEYSLRAQRCGLEPIDFNAGTHDFDLNYDRPSYYTGTQKHIKIEIGGFVCTSLLLVIRKG